MLKQQVVKVMSLLNISEMVIVTMKTTMRAAILMAVTVVDLMLIHNIAWNAYVLKIWVVLLHQTWLEMGFVTMKPTLQSVRMILEIAAESVSIQTFALNVFVRMVANQQLTYHVSF